MFDSLITLLPDSLTLTESLFLVTLAGGTSLLTATLGIGGGALLLAVMAQMMPVAALIPVHGLVQFGSNFNRALLTWRHIDRVLITQFMIGAVIGALIASMIVVQLPLTMIQIAVGLFILWIVWGPKPKGEGLSPRGAVIAGVLTTIISMFVGATGPLVGGIVYRTGAEKLTKVATMAAALTGQHLLKGVVFAFVGFSFIEWLPLIALMILSGAVGTWVGLNILHKISSERFNQLFRLVITLLALRLLWQGLMAL